MGLVDSLSAYSTMVLFSICRRRCRGSAPCGRNLAVSMASVNPLPRAGLQNQDFPGIVVYAVDDPVVPADPDVPISEVPLIFLAPVGFGSSASLSMARSTRSYSRRGSRLMDLQARRVKITSYKTRPPYPFSPGSSPPSRSLLRSSSISWTASSRGRSSSSPRAMAWRASSAAHRSARSSRASIRRSYSRTSRITPMRSPFSSVT